MKHRSSPALVLLPLAAAVAPACSASNPPAAGEEGGGGASASSVSSSTSVSVVTSGTGEFTGPACSADMQSVVDAMGQVIGQCPSDQGCFEGHCVPACEAAAASKGSIGCDFWAPDPAFYQNGLTVDGTQEHGPCYAVFLANAWSRPAKIAVTRGTQTFNVSALGRIPKGIGPSIQYETVPPTGVPPG